MAKPNEGTPPAKTDEKATDPRDAELAALRAQLEAAEAEKLAAQVALAEAAEQIRIRPLAPGAKVGAPVFFAKCEISNSGHPVRPGEPLPFDPTDPPKGFDGLVEGVHFTRG